MSTLIKRMEERNLGNTDAGNTTLENRDHPEKTLSSFPSVEHAFKGKVRDQNQSGAECSHDRKDGEYDGRICDQNFNRRTDSDHLATNASKHCYRCEECGKGFQYNALLCEHLKRVHDRLVGMGKQHQRYIFGRKVSSMKPMRNPLRINKENRYHWNCALCGATFPCRFDRNRHRCHLLSSEILHNRSGSEWRNGKAKAYLCPVCDRAFNAELSWKRHMVVHLGQQKFECPVCSRKFMSTRDVKRHIRMKHTTYWHQIGHCNWDLRICEKTQHNSGLERKILRDDEEKTSQCNCSLCGYNCALCGATFSCSFDRNRHRCHLLSSEISQNLSGSEWTNGEAEAYLCPICNRAFNVKVSWKRHMDIHLGQQKYQCPVCSRKFTCTKDARMHIEMKHATYWHQGGCNNWDLRIGEKTQHNSGLERKTLRINKEKRNQWNCALCGATFSCRFDCNRHRCHLLSSEILQNRSGSEWTNGKAKAYLCPICNRAFNIKVSWKRHMVVHLGQQKYECPVCSRKFICTRDARQHVISHRKKELSQHAVKKHLLSSSLPSEMVLAENLRKDDADSNGDGWVPIEESQCKVQSLNKDEDMAEETPRKEKMSTCQLLCEECGRKFTYLRNYQKHMTNMHNKSVSHQRDFCCALCGKRFLLYHQLISHDCGAVNSGLFLRRNESNTSEAGNYECAVCKRMFTTEETWKKHKKSHHGVQLSDSAYRYVRFHSKNQMRNQLGAEHKYLCSVCGKSCEFRSNFENHQMAPTDSLPYLCSLCHKRFSCRVDLTYHTGECLLSTCKSSTAISKNTVKDDIDSGTEMLEGHTPEASGILVEEHLHKDPRMNEDQGSAENTAQNIKRGRCDRKECRKYSKPKTKKQEQVENVHSSGDNYGDGDSYQGPSDDKKTALAVSVFREKHQCAVSSKEYSTGQDLSRRKGSRNWDSPLRCKWCPERCYTKSELDAHESIHKIGHQCHICGNSYPFLMALWNHMSDHSPTHPYSCSRCGKRFRFDADLRNHHKEHLSPGIMHDDLSYEFMYMYQCALCGRRFSELCDLGKHRDVHLMEEPYTNSASENRVSRGKTSQSRCHFNNQGYCDTVMQDLNMQSVEEGYKMPEVHNVVGEDCVDDQRLMPDLTEYSIKANENFSDMLHTQDVECRDNCDGAVLPDLSKQIGEEEECQCMLCDKKFGAHDELKTHLETDCM